MWLVEGLQQELPRLELVWLEEAYSGAFCKWAQPKQGQYGTFPCYPDRQLWRSQAAPSTKDLPNFPLVSRRSNQKSSFLEQRG